MRARCFYLVKGARKRVRWPWTRKIDWADSLSAMIAWTVSRIGVVVSAKWRMDSVHVSVPLRGGKRMKKRRELDAKRNSAQQQSNGCMQSSRDQLLTASSDEGGPWPPSAKSRAHAAAAARARARSRCCRGLLRGCSALLVFACAVATTTVMWLFIDIREQLTSLRTELDQGPLNDTNKDYIKLESCFFSEGRIYLILIC